MKNSKKLVFSMLLAVVMLISNMSVLSYANDTEVKSSVKSIKASKTTSKPKTTSKLASRPKTTPKPKATPKPTNKPKTSSNATAKPIPTPVVVQSKNVFMWEVLPKNTTSKAKVYLMGSIHVGDKSNYPLDKRIETAFQESDNLVLEIDPSSMSQAQNLELANKYAIYPEGDSLKNHLSDSAYKKLSEALAKLGIPMTKDIDAAKPWLLASQISSLQFQQAGYDPYAGVDFYFMNKALAAKKTIKELESYEFQYKLFSDMSDKIQESYLMGVIDGKDTSKNTLADLYKFWKAGDSKGMESKIFPKDLRMTDDEKDFNKLLFDQRNIGMTDKIKGYLDGDSGTYFVVAGSGHLIGDNGIVKMLEAQGYSVKQK